MACHSELPLLLRAASVSRVRRDWGARCLISSDFPEAPIDLPSRLNVELLRSSLVHLSVEREGLGRIDAVGGASRKRFYTLCLGANLDVHHRLVVGWSGFLDSSRMMGSESWQVFGLGAAIWGRY